MHSCSICGQTQTRFREILWKQLVDQWQLSPAEAHYIDRQQGEHCTGCGANLRSMALATAILAACDSTATLQQFVTHLGAATLATLEINEAGNLHPVLALLPHHTFAEYPKVDMHALPYPDASFDLVVHSDTLEHVPNPVHALQECRRVLKPGGSLCFTVPLVVARLSRGRAGLPPSHHGASGVDADDYIVHTEFGADAWTFVAEAGFTRIAIFTRDYPAATAITARA